MEGQVFVPYTGIGGYNMMSDASTYAISGSTTPGVIEDEWGTTLNINWQYPGGITGKQYNGQGFWGYAVQAQYAGGQYSYDDTITAWLMGQITGTHYPTPEHIFTESEIQNQDPRIKSTINELIFRYGSVLLNNPNTHYDEFKTYFKGCYVIGRV